MVYRCYECAANLKESDPDSIGMCGYCGAYAPKWKERKPPFRRLRAKADAKPPAVKERRR